VASSIASESTKHARSENHTREGCAHAALGRDNDQSPRPSSHVTSPVPSLAFCELYRAGGSESVGIVDLIAIRKDHKAHGGFKHGDRFQIILIQVKGGSAAKPTDDDANRLRAVARYHRAQCVLLASWKEGKSAQFFYLQAEGSSPRAEWFDISDLVDEVFTTPEAFKRHMAAVQARKTRHRPG